MPNYAYLETEVSCPYCAHRLNERFVCFQWGYCPSYGPQARYIYQLGDPIYWRPCHDGHIEAWTYFGDGGANIGDPAYQDLIVRDTANYYISPFDRETRRACPQCGYPIEGAALEIRQG